MRIAVEVKRNLRSSMIRLLQKQKEKWLRQSSYEQFMMFTDRISRGMADGLRSGGIWFVDEAGNGFLEIRDRLLVNVTGRESRHMSSAKGQYYSPLGSKALLFLVEHGPEIVATYGDIQTSVDVLLGKISQVMTELLEGEVLAKRAQGKYVVISPARLPDMWTTSFVEKLQPRLLVGRYRSPYGTDFEHLLTEHAKSVVLDDVVIRGSTRPTFSPRTCDPVSSTCTCSPSASQRYVENSCWHQQAMGKSSSTKRLPRAWMHR